MRGCITQRGNFSHHGEKIKPCPETCFGDDKMPCLLQPFGMSLPSINTHLVRQVRLRLKNRYRRNGRFSAQLPRAAPRGVHLSVLQESNQVKQRFDHSSCLPRLLRRVDASAQGERQLCQHEQRTERGENKNLDLYP